MATDTFDLILPDTTAPTISDITPRDGQIEVSLQPEITFTLRDGYDINFSRTETLVAGKIAIDAGVVQSGFSMTLTRIDGGTPGEDPGDGYSVVLIPDEAFDYNQEVTVSVAAFDVSAGNQSVTSITWTTVDPRPPIFDVVPSPGDSDFGVDTNIWFEAFQDGYGIDPNTLYLHIDGNTAIINGIIQTPDYTGVINEVDSYGYYNGTINPRFILEPETTHSISIGAEEPLSGNLGSLGFTFETGGGPNNPKTIYIGDKNGVKSIMTNEITGVSTPTILVDGYYVHDLYAKVLKYANRLAIGTRDHGAIIYTTNYSMDSLHYSVGDEISKVWLTSNHNGTLYLDNRTHERIDVYYNILFDDVGRDIPDTYYGVDGYALVGILDGYFTDVDVTEGTSTVSTGSNSIFIGTSTGVFRIETDESTPGSTEINGEITSYGIINSDRDYSILSGTTNYVVALDVNTRLNHLYVATRSESSDDENALTYIDLADNSFDGSIPEERLIHRLINDISFKDDE